MNQNSSANLPKRSGISKRGRASASISLTPAACAGAGCTHSDAGGEIRRDEVPVALQPFEQPYFEQVRKRESTVPPRRAWRRGARRHRSDRFTDTVATLDSHAQAFGQSWGFMSG